MKTIQNISVVEDVTLVSLNDSPADMNTISKIFDMISTNNIDVDMISQTPPHSNKPHLSFTVSGDDLGKILELSAKIRDLYPDVKLSVSNGNCKISVFGEAMKGQPGVAAKVFAAAAKANTDIIMITTSEVDISMLVPQSDLTATLESIKGAFNNLIYLSIHSLTSSLSQVAHSSIPSPVLAQIRKIFAFGFLCLIYSLHFSTSKSK